jgi:hypothetical protein
MVGPHVTITVDNPLSSYCISYWVVCCGLSSGKVLVVKPVGPDSAINFLADL